jgi:hypothetical protein
MRPFVLCGASLAILVVWLTVDDGSERTVWELWNEYSRSVFTAGLPFESGLLAVFAWAEHTKLSIFDPSTLLRTSLQLSMTLCPVVFSVANSDFLGLLSSLRLPSKSLLEAGSKNFSIRGFFPLAGVVEEMSGALADAVVHSRTLASDEVAERASFIFPVSAFTACFAPGPALATLACCLSPAPAPLETSLRICLSPGRQTYGWLVPAVAAAFVDS